MKKIMIAFPGNKKRIFASVIVYPLIFLTLSFSILIERVCAQDLLLKISGTAQADVQYDRITGKDQHRPEWIRTFKISPNISFSSFSIDLPIMLSTLEEGFRQPFNRFGLHFRNEWLDATILDAHPVFSEYSLNGVLVRGGTVQVTPGDFVIMFTGGQTKRAIEGSSGTPPSFKQNLYGFRVGKGKEDGVFFAHINFIKAKDKYEPDYARRSTDSIDVNTPKDNLVSSLDWGVRLFEKALSLKSEISACSYVRDSRVKTADLSPGNLTRKDLAFHLKIAYAINNTRVEAFYKELGSNYVSLGSPSMINDQRSVSFSLNQMLLKNTLNLDVNVATSRDNLSALKASTTTTNTYMTNVSFMPEGLPFFTAGLNYFTNSNDGNNDLYKLDVTNLMLTFGSGYNFSTSKFFDLTHSLNIMFSANSFGDKSPPTGTGNDNDVFVYGFSSNHRFRIPISINWGVTLNQYRSDIQPYTHLWNYNAGINSRFFEDKLNSSIRFVFGTNTNSRMKNQKGSFVAENTYRITNFADIRLTAERNSFQNKILKGESYEEFVVRLSSTIRW